MVIRKNKYSSEINNDSARSNDLAKVPVVLMIAMSPAMMNGKTPIQYMPLDEGNMTEVFEQQPIEENDATYVARSEEFQQKYPFDVAWLSHKKVQQIVPATASGQKTNLVLCSSNFNDNTVRKIYLIKDNEKNPYESHEPQYITELVYHNIGKNKEYLGVTILKDVFDKNTHQYRGTIQYESRLDDESAQFLLDFNAGSTKWKDVTGIKYRETTNPNVARTISY
jgi:hypothetical protein